MGIATVIGTITGMADRPPWPTSPVVAVDGIDAVSPLRAPFTVRNKSLIFPIHLTSVRCDFTRLESPLLKLDDVSIREERPPQTIAASDARPMQCSIDLGDAVSVRHVSMTVRLRYEHWLGLVSGEQKTILT